MQPKSELELAGIHIADCRAGVGFTGRWDLRAHYSRTLCRAVPCVCHLPESERQENHHHHLTEYTDTTRRVYATKDLFIPHPTEKNLWKVYVRRLK